MAAAHDWNWTFRGFVNDRGENVAQVWYDSQLGAAQSEFEILLSTIRHSPVTEWSPMGNSTYLSGEKKKLLELKFKAANERYRPIGVFGNVRQTFIILAIANKHDFNELRKKSLNRAVLVANNPGVYSNECDCLSGFTR